MHKKLITIFMVAMLVLGISGCFTNQGTTTNDTKISNNDIDVDTIECDYCYEEFPAEYVYIYEGEKLCPKHTQDLLENVDTIECDICSEKFPAEYAYVYEGEKVCPKHMRELLEEIYDFDTVKCETCNNFISRKWSELCDDCIDVYGRSCRICGEIRECWSANLDFLLCEHCLANHFKDEDLQNLVVYYYD